MNHYKSRIAAQKSHLLKTVEPLAVAAALLAITAQAEAVTVYTTEGLSYVWDGTAINPFNGAYGVSSDSWGNGSFTMLVGICGADIYQPGEGTPIASFLTSTYYYSGGSYDLLQSVSLDTILDSQTAFTAVEQWSSSGDNQNGTRYYAFRYTNQGPDQDETYYGWVELQINDYQTYVSRFALGGNNEPVAVGASGSISAIPEPTTFACLGGVAMVFGSGLIRRRR